MDEEIQARYAVGRQLALDAGELAAGYFARVSELAVRSKGVQDVVTEADVQVEMLIKGRLAEAFPGDAFLGEETGASDLTGSSDAPGSGAGGVWVVDPIDGTQPFVSGLVGWCVSIAYVYERRLRFGFVYNPPLGELFEGGEDHPALLNGREIHPHDGADVTDGIVSVGYSPRVGPDQILPVLERLLRSGGTYFRNGSGALSLCYVACGRLLGYVEPHMNSWDCLGAFAVIQAAGGRTNDFLVGDALMTGNKIVAGPPRLYRALEAILG